MTPHWLVSLAEHARRQPESLAIAASGQSLTYGQLLARSQNLAHRLAAAGVGRESLVAVALPTGPARALASLAVLQAGAAYLPLADSEPPGRLEAVLWDAGVELLLAPLQLADRLAGAAPATWTIRGLQDLPDTPIPEALPAPDPGDLAYVVYTSGSTGTPKGVEIEHRALALLIAWHQAEYRLTPADRASLLAYPAFDAAVWELWPYLAAGASLHAPPPDVGLDAVALRDWLLAEAVTLAFAPTPLAEQLMALPWPGVGSLRALLTGGDRLRCFPPSDLPFPVVNHYGPTEAAVVTTYGVVPPGGQGLPSIGRPVPYLQVRACDAQQREVPGGAEGELCIAGPALARGYRHDPSLSALRFLRDPVTGQRLYRTGDWARRRADGEVEFLGRADRQVKVRGWRVEPAEVERRLLAHPAVADALVEFRPPAGRVPAEPRLVAYLVARSADRHGLATLRAALRATLPEPMLPVEVRWLSAIPRTAQGKWHRAALDSLPVLASDAPDEPQPVLPLGPTAHALTGILAEALGLEHIGPDQDFFLLGGHSLLGVQLIARVRDELGVALPLRAIFDHPTAFRLAAEIDRRRAAPAGRGAAS